MIFHPKNLLPFGLLARERDWNLNCKPPHVHERCTYYVLGRKVRTGRWHRFNPDTWTRARRWTLHLPWA